MGSLHCLVLLSLYAALAAASEEKKHWCYLSQKCQDPNCEEPRFWKVLYNECGSNEQSPINIVTSKVEYNWNLTPFTFEKYSTKQQTNWTIQNNGHSVKVTLDESAKITSGGLVEKYKAMQFHFHWGNNDSQGTSPGSEHSIDGERYAMELHIVHIKDKYTSVEEAAANNGVAVLGFFIEVGLENSDYKPLIEKLQDIPFQDNTADMEPLPLASLIPKSEHLTSYYRYEGSLTTPGCNEKVVWTLFEKPIELSLAQIQEFWMKLYFGTTTTLPMADNFRPVQPLGNRTVFKSESNTLLPPAKVLLLIPTATFIMLSMIQ